jgi:hypothetical protein
MAKIVTAVEVASEPKREKRQRKETQRKEPTLPCPYVMRLTQYDASAAASADRPGEKARWVIAEVVVRNGKSSSKLVLLWIWNGIG